jgi:hypothetical protein
MGNIMHHRIDRALGRVFKCADSLERYGIKDVKELRNPRCIDSHMKSAEKLLGRIT